MAASTPKIVCRDFGGDAEISQQRQLYYSAFPETKGATVESESHYVWKFRQFPASPAAFEYGAYSDDRLVGYYAAVPFPYKIDGREVTCAMVCDVMTHPDFQGRGIFTSMGRYSLGRLKASGIEITTGFPIRPAVIPGHLKVGWKIAFDLPMFLRPLRSSAILQSKGLGFASPIVDAVLNLANAVGALNRSRGSFSVKTSCDLNFARDPEVEFFLKQSFEQIPNYLRKDFSFYEWRLNAPGFEYKAIELRKDDKCVGLTIARRTELHGIPVLAILDMMILAGFENGLPVLHAALATIARQTEAEAIVTMMSSFRARQFGLRKHFFLRTPFIFKFIVNRLNAGIDETSLLTEEAWHLMWIDSDDL